MFKILFHGSSSNGIHKVARLWNTHRIRPSANPESPSGRPAYLYFIPRANNTRDYLTQVGVDEVDIAEEHFAQEPSLRGCSPYFNELAEMIMEDEGLEIPIPSGKLKICI